MLLRFQTPEGHEDSSTRASVESALRAAYDLDAEEIVVAILGSYVLLEGFVCRKSDAEWAVEIAEEVVGKGYVRSRILRR
jgi:osmotically-inducible protein OsmY